MLWHGHYHKYISGIYLDQAHNDAYARLLFREYLDIRSLNLVFVALTILLKVKKICFIFVVLEKWKKGGLFFKKFEFFT